MTKRKSAAPAATKTANATKAANALARTADVLKKAATVPKVAAAKEATAVKAAATVVPAIRINRADVVAVVDAAAVVAVSQRTSNLWLEGGSPVGSSLSSKLLHPKTSGLKSSVSGISLLKDKRRFRI